MQPSGRKQRMHIAYKSCYKSDFNMGTYLEHQLASRWSHRGFQQNRYFHCDSSQRTLKHTASTNEPIQSTHINDKSAIQGLIITQGWTFFFPLQDSRVPMPNQLAFLPSWVMGLQFHHNLAIWSEDFGYLSMQSVISFDQNVCLRCLRSAFGCVPRFINDLQSRNNSNAKEAKQKNLVEHFQHRS